MTEAAIELNQTEDSKYGNFFAILWRRRLWFTGVFVAVMAVAVPLALKKQPTYLSTIQLLVEPNSEDKIENQFTDSTVEADYATQLNLMRSSQLLEEAVEILKPEYPQINVDSIQAAFKIKQVEEGDIGTKIFQANYIAQDPQKTQKVLEAIQTVYQNYNQQQQEKRLNEGLNFIDGQIPEIRKAKADAEAQLEEFRTQHNLITPEKEAEAIALSLRKIIEQRQALQAEFNQAQTQYQLMQQYVGQSVDQALSASRLSESKRYQNLLDQLQQTELELAKAGTVYTEDNPVIQELQEQKENQQQLLGQEIERLLGSQARVEDPNSLRQQGQLGATELKLVSDLIELNTRLQSLEAQDQSLSKTEAQLREQLNRFPNLIAQYNNLQQEVAAKRANLQKLLEARQALGIELNQGGFTWQVVESPRLGTQIGPNTNRDILLGAALGLFLGGVAAFVREALDDSVHTSQQLKLPAMPRLLGVTPKLPQLALGGFAVELPWHSQRSLNNPLDIAQWLPFREASDLIYKNIQLRHNYSDISSIKDLSPVGESIVITSALAGEGKSTIAIALAFSAARLYQKVLLVDGNLRQPSLHQQLHLVNYQGLSDYLSGQDNHPPTIQKLSLSECSFDVLSAGSQNSDPVRLLASTRLPTVIKQLEQEYDLVIVDSPPTIGRVDTIQLVSCCTGAVIVGRMDHVTMSQLSDTHYSLSKFNVIGIVANGANVAQTKDYVSIGDRQSNELATKFFDH